MGYVPAGMGGGLASATTPFRYSTASALDHRRGVQAGRPRPGVGLHTECRDAGASRVNIPPNQSTATTIYRVVVIHRVVRVITVCADSYTEANQKARSERC